MALVHPFQPTAARSSRWPRRTTPSPATPSAHSTSGTDAPGGAPRSGDTVAALPGAGLPRELVVDETGRPRRAVLLAAIMIRRGRTVEQITTATGLPADVVTGLVPGV